MNEPDPDADSSSISQMDPLSQSKPENMEPNMDGETPPQEPVTQESPPEIPNENGELETAPEEVEEQETSPEQVDENDELDAPIAEQESVGDMQVPPPSPNEDQEKEETKVRIEDVDQLEPEVFLEDVSPEVKEDTALVPEEPQGQSTPKPKKKRRGPSRPCWTLPSIYR